LFLDHNLILTILLVFAKGMGAGIVAGALFKLVSKFNKYVGVIVAAISAPIVNTGIFVIGCLLFFRELTGVGIYSLFITVNFGLAIAINAALVPVIYHLLEITGVFNKK
jgi:hypothetical protein